MTFFPTPRYRGISFKLLFYILCFSTLITVIITAINVYTDYSMEMNLMEKRIDRIGRTSLKSLAHSLWYMDRNYAQTQMVGLLQFPDVQYLEIISPVKENTMSVGDFQAKQTATYELPLSHEANGVVYDLGTIRIVMNLASVHHRIFNRVLIILVTQALKTFIVSGFIFLIVQWLITRHLETIASFVHRLDIDNLEQELELNQQANTQNELTQVAGAINLMRHELNRKIQSLKKSENRYRTLVENAPIAILLLSPSGEIMDLNSEAERIYGEMRQGLVGKNFIEESFTTVQQPKMAEEMGVLAQGKSPKTCEAELVSKGGEEYHLLWNFSRLLDGQNHALGSIAIGLDISDRRELEVQLLQAKKMESVGRLAGGIAHDSNNMLTIILGNTEMLLEDLGPADPFFLNLKEIETAAKRSADLTRQLLAFARKQAIAPETVNLNDVIQRILNMLGRLIGDAIELLWHPNETVWSVKVDPSQIDQLLTNLCLNARDAIHTAGKILIGTDNVRFDDAYCQTHKDAMPGEYVQITVSDNGCGMDQEVLDNLFEPFFTTKKIGEGTGLGLATVYGIMKQNNGFIQVHTEPGQGSTFKMYFPRDRDSHRLSN